ncbi:MAG: DUF389 domain-containing protein [Corynebacteriales bacterium]|nr:DUF389 domain-containing protein [Mycobacteriales bacterium]
MLHLRLISPNETTAEVLRVLGKPSVTNVVRLDNAAQSPRGDVILCDVAREGGSEILADLRKLGLEKYGSIAIENVDVSLSAAANTAMEAAPGLSADAVVWEEIEQRTGDETHVSFTYVVFFIVATIIAGIGVLLDQPILIVGAMVVGPEFGPLAALCVGLVRRRAQIVGRALLALVVGFGCAMVATIFATWGLYALDLADKSMLLEERPLTDFIWRPDALSWIVGFLAGVAGMLSLTSAKSGALVGVLISVTTVPAAANVAVALAFGVGDEAAGSALQLLINVAAIVVAGVLTLGIQRLSWRRSV